MYLYDFTIQNKEVFKLVYTIVIGLICAIIVIKTDRLFKISLHQGIRYFRNAFFFYGLAFILRYLLGVIYFFTPLMIHVHITKIVFEFFLTMAGFSLLYSLLWKKFEPRKESTSSLFNVRFLLFYSIAIIIAVLDYLWDVYYFMFSLQIILFGYAAIVSYIKYREAGKKARFLKSYFIVILINLVVWIANFIVATFLEWHKAGLIVIYILNIVIFFLFLYGVFKVTKKRA